jgi:hypothetical protein
MRRRPSAVYRVIDEEELLGGHTSPDTSIPIGAWGPPAGPLAAPPAGLSAGPPAGSPASRRRLRGLTGWGSTALAVGALAAVAAALLSLGDDIGASNPAAAPAPAVARTPPRLRTTASRPSRRMPPPDRRRTPTRPRFTASKSTTAWLGRAEPRRLRRRVNALRYHPADGPSTTVAPAEPSPAQAGPAQEFGFER